ncbi:MAG: pyruvate formate lyase-activating protein [Clostridiales bacterium]|nr:pyruvate formate lyase-activating protein [Clostridiales bacterium]
MTEGIIHSIESMGLVDGPGIRTVVFMQGCRLRCQYCHNPDMWAMEDKTASRFTPKELLEKLIRYKAYYGNDGGVTFSGGEPLMQDEFLKEILPMCQQEGINTCLDTAGCGRWDYDEILDHTDLVLFDVKHYTPEGYRLVTGHSPAEADAFLEAAQRHGTPLWVRHVVVPGLTDSEEHLKGLEKYLQGIANIKRVELLPYHVLGVPKYETMGIDYPLKGVEPVTPESLDAWNRRLNETCCSVKR